MAGEHNAQDGQFPKYARVGPHTAYPVHRLQEPNIPLFFNYLETYTARE